MKRFIFLFTSLFIAFTMTGHCQSDQVSFIHGLGDDTTVWETMADQLQAGYDFTRDDVGYNSSASITSTASSVYIPNGTVGVGHSLGGVLAREYLRQHSPSDMKALITVGSPHLGAPVAEAVEQDKVTEVIGGWLNDLAAGPAATAGQVFGQQMAENIVAGLGIEGSEYLHNKVEGLYGNKTSVSQLQPTSSFMSTLNSSPNATLPAARYAVFGSEKNPEYLRLAQSFVGKANGDPLEDETTFITYHRAATYFYAAVTAYYSYLAANYMLKHSNTDPSDPNHFFYYDQAVYFASIASDWARGFITLAYYMQRDWDQQIIGVNYYYVNGQVYKDANDGLLPATTQAPSYFTLSNDNISRRIRADGANHIEQTVHPSVESRLEEIFLNQDVNIPEAQDDGGDGGGGLPPPDDGCGQPGNPCDIE